jgi:hypothetical protein
VIGCSSEVASCEGPALLWCELFAEIAGVRVAVVTAAGDRAPLSWRALRRYALRR